MSSLALTPILQAIRTLLSVNTLDNAKKLASTVGLILIEPSSFQIVEHTTKKGKAIRGVVRTDLSYGEAKAIDEYTFKKDGGWFIREKYLTDTQENTPVITQNEPTANVKSDTLVNDKDNGIDTLKTRFKPASKDVRRADKNLSAKDGAKLLKQTLSKLFPDTKFSVVMSRGTGYGSVDVRWTDGASNDLVRVVLNHFEGKGYDGMEDMAIYKNAIDESGNPVGYGLGYVSGHRELSKGFLEKFLSSLPENLKDLATKYNVAVSGSDENAYLINLNENWISSRFNEALSATSTGKYNFGNVPKAEARNQNQEEDADLSLTWTKDSTRKIWRSDNGKIITDESSVVGGKKTAFFAVYQDQEEREHGNNYASGKTLTEAKQLAETDPKPVISEKLQRFIDGIVSNSAVIGGYENFKVQYQYLDWNPYGKNTTDLIRDLKLAGYGKVGAIKRLFEENVVNNFSLIGQTEAERLAEEARIKAIEQQKRDQEEKARLKAQADKELSDFRLTGSSLPSDVAASYGQDDMFVATRGIQQVQGQSIEQELNVNEKAEILEKYGFITEVHGKWKYTTQNGVYPKFTANSKESAVEGAWPYYLKTPQDQLKTKEQKYQDSVQSFNQDMEKRYGSLSNDEISQKIDKISAEIKSLQAVGGREFTGNGTRRTSAATSNEGARQLGEEKMQLEAYLKSRTESQGPLKGQSLNNENAPELAGKDGFMPHPDWRKNKFFARQYARALGLDIAGGILTPIEDIVPKIDAFNLLPTEEREAKLKAATGTEADRENALSIIKNVLNENPTGDFKGLREQALNQLKQKFGKPIDQIYKDIDEFDEIFSKAKRQAFLEYAQKLPIPLSIDAIPYDTAYRAHTWASMKPESRAENFRFGFVESLALLWKSIEQRYNAADDEAKERVKTAFASIVDKYKELQMASLAATSRTANWMVTGPAKFNTRRNEKANNAERVKIEAAYEFISQKAPKILNKALIGDIDNSISSQIIDMEKRISEAKQVQENIKNLNKIFNSKKLTDDEKVKAVMALNIGFDTEEKAKDALKPSPYFAIPNLDANRLYKTSLVNNNANIKRMEEQLASYKARQAVAQTAQASDEEIEIAGVKVELNAQDNRIRLFFDGKPDADTINALKKSAFKWSPSNSAWQRQLTGNAVVAAESILNNLAERTGQEKGKLPRISNQFNSIGSDYSPTEIIELIKSLANKKDDTLASDLAKAIGLSIKEFSTDSLSDDPNSPNYRYKDIGYIAGSRKEQAQASILLAKKEGLQVFATDIDWDALEENSRIAADTITKKNVFGQVDWEALKAGGMHGNVGYLIKRIYAAVALKPDFDDTKTRKLYVTAIQNLRQIFEKCKTYEEAKNELVALSKLLNTYRNMVKGEDGNTTLNYDSQVAHALGKKLKSWVFKTGNDALYDARKMAIDDWSWLEPSDKTTTTAPKKKPFQLEAAEDINRVGGAKVDIKSTEQFKDAFGLKAIQSGNWVLKDKESIEFHVQRAAEAMSDMADVTGIPANLLGFGDRLGLSFGARGKGSALAHYEPVQRVINITKMKGGGSLGHEYFHALDNIIRDLMHQKDNGEAGYFATENPNLLPDGLVKTAFQALRQAMKVSARNSRMITITEEMRIRIKSLTVVSLIDNLRLQNVDLSTPNKLIEGLASYSGNRYTGVYKNKEITQQGVYVVLACMIHLGMMTGNENEVEFPVLWEQSDFEKSAIELDGGKQGKYWSKPLEMAARAYSAYLQDRLDEQGRVNDYLAYSTKGGNSRVGEVAYPQGEERKAINAAFDQLFAALREQQVFENALSNQDLMNAIFANQVDSFNALNHNYSMTEVLNLIKRLSSQKDDTLAGELAQAIGVQIKKPTPSEFLKGDAVASIKSGQIKPNAEGKIINGAMDWIRDYLAKNRPSQVFFNPSVGDIVLSPRSIKSAMNHKPLPIDIQAIPAIPEVLEKAIVLDKSMDDEGKDIANIVIAAPVEIDNERYYLVMRLRRDTRSEHSQPRFYTVAAVLEKEAIKTATSLMTRALSPEDDSGLTGGRSRLLNVLHKALAVNEDPKNFSAWFSNSKVVDASGNPLLVYHGSSSEDVIEKFDRLFLVSKGKKDGLDSIGTWFTDNKDRVTDYGNKKVYAAYIRLVNPLILQSFDELREYWSEVQESNPDKQVQKAYKANNHHGDSTDFVAELSAKYDGIIIKQHGDGEWKNQTAYVVFNSNQIKVINVEADSFNSAINCKCLTNMTNNCQRADCPRKVDGKAHQAATSPHNDLAEPTDAQKLAGNYKTGKININGLAISIENPQGSTRSGVNAEGKEWSNTMQHHYGYINGTEGADGDHLDVFVVPGISEDYQGSVFIIDQVDPLTGDFDEHKIIIGAKSHKTAKEIYLANYDADWQGFGDSTELTMSEFKDWLKNGDLTRPISHEFEDLYNDIGGFNFIPAISFDDTLNAIKALMANNSEDNAQRLAMLTGLRLQQTEPDIDLDMFGEPVNQGFDLFGEPIQNGDESPVEELPRLAVVELPLDKLTLSEDVPQFKSGADGESGVVEALGGKFDRTGVAPIQVWERTDGRLEIISGRHRTDLARRSGEKTIPAQVHKESEGFTAKQAMMLDAELNIRDGQGKVKDYVDYFTHSEISEEEAERRGLIARSIGQRAFTIASKGSEELITLHRNEIISDQAAAEIASIAPNNSAMQAVGLRVLQDNKPLNNALNTIKAVMALTREKGQEPDTFDLFGFDDSALKEAEAMARIASRKQRQIAEQLNAIKGAVKNPKLAARHGVVVENEADALAKVQTMTAQKARWDNWSSHADLLAEVRAELNDSHNNLGVIDGSSSNGWIGVDLDGTLAKFYGWDGIEKIGEPILVMLERVKEWLSFGFDVRIFTARAANPEAIPYIKQWCREHIGQELPITNVKDMYMAQLWDNIAVTIESNTGEIIKSEVEISD